jgi:hypothetical protein
VLYGVGSPLAPALFATWLRQCDDRREPWALIAVPLCSRFGKRAADVALRHSLVASAFRPLFDLAVARSHRRYAAKLLGERPILAEQ